MPMLSDLPIHTAIIGGILVFFVLLFVIRYSGHLSELEARSLHEKSGEGGRSAFGRFVRIIRQGQNS